MKLSKSTSYTLAAVFALTITVVSSGCALLTTPEAKSLISQAPQEVQDAAALASKIPEPAGCIELPLDIRFGCDARDVWHEFNDAPLDADSVRTAYIGTYMPMVTGKTETVDLGTVERFRGVALSNYGNIRDANLGCFKDVILRQMTVNSVSDGGLKTLSAFQLLAGAHKDDMMDAAVEVIAEATGEIDGGINPDLLDGTQVAMQVIPADVAAGFIAACGAIQ